VCSAKCRRCGRVCAYETSGLLMNWIRSMSAWSLTCLMWMHVGNTPSGVWRRRPRRPILLSRSVSQKPPKRGYANAEFENYSDATESFWVRPKRTAWVRMRSYSRRAMSALGQKLTWWGRTRMSASCHKRTSRIRGSEAPTLAQSLHGSYSLSSKML